MSSNFVAAWNRDEHIGEKIWYGNGTDQEIDPGINIYVNNKYCVADLIILQISLPPTDTIEGETVEKRKLQLKAANTNMIKVQLIRFSRYCAQCGLIDWLF